MNLWIWIYTALWFILPAYLSDIVPVLVKDLNILNYPLDGNRKLKGKPFLGTHKTWRGLVFGIIGGVIVSLLQQRGVVIGFLLGTGNLLGDSIGAFVKRRLANPPGSKSLLLDALPSTSLAVIFTYLGGVLSISFPQALFVIFAVIPLKLLANRFWYLSGKKEVPW